MRINSYHIPNRTLSSYIPGVTKTGKDSCLVRGFWGDITNSPYIGFGVELNNEEEHEFFYAHQDIYYKYHSQHITEWNLARYLTRLEKDELYQLKFTDHKIKNVESEENKERENKKENEIEKESENKENKNEEKEKTILSTEATLDGSKSNENKERDKYIEEEVDTSIKKEEDVKNIEIEKLKIDDKVNSNYENYEGKNKEEKNSSANKFELNQENKDNVLMGFECFDLKVVLVTGEIDQIFKKKK